ncbi:putative pectinesterase/pectinesterase inhibitor 12 [Silene latifolia]|uniref:putative pectinesterase/pectinesterase inhibitor 12 n=1 Tax=Silene latifolia TaxID=37657 RepID=UPI003D772212
MAAFLAKHHFLLLLPLFSFTFFSTPLTSALKNSSSNDLTNLHLLQIQSICKTTPYPNVCFNSLKLSVSINIPGDLLNFILTALENTITEVTKLSTILATTTPYNLIEKQRGAIQDCKELHQISLIALKTSLPKIKASKISDARAFLSATLTNKDTCLEGLASASGPRQPILVSSLISTYKHVSNSLSMLSNPRQGPHKAGVVHAENHHGRRLLVGLPKWLDRKNRKILQNDDYSGNDGNDPSESIVVATDGSGNFTSIQEAINYAPNNSEYRTFIYVRQGIYEENVEVPSYKTNIVMLGDGRDNTIITGNRSVGDGWTTFRSATLAVSGEGFLARDMGFENIAGPEKHQAVALRINADLAAIYRCTIIGYQDTLYVHSFRQFYRECNIYGTIDYIFGNAAVVLQGCNIVTRMPLPGQFTAITAQSRDNPDENTGISIQNCTVLAAEDLYSNKSKVKSYLGRPWKKYARTVYIESYIDDFIDPSGWSKWSDNNTVDTLYYGEYGNQGPGSLTESRVSWGGYHVMDYDEASNFTVSQFIVGDEWLDSTSFPYDDTI